jgi:hypothetical protein
MFLCLTTEIDNKDFFIIASDNKTVNYFPYYRFVALIDNKDVHFRR